MARYLLDTDAVIDYLMGIPSSLAQIQELHARGETLCVCAVVIAEVYAGLLPKHQKPAKELRPEGVPPGGSVPGPIGP